MSLPIIVFDSFKISPRGEKYYCPFNCSDPRYPIKSWKTEKGFRKHLDTCPNSPEKVAKKNEIKRLRDDKEAADAKLALATASHKVGDTIWYIREHIKLPTHEQRGLRTVRVRYEEVRGYHPEMTTITSVNYKNGSLLYNDHIKPNMICNDILPRLKDGGFLCWC